MSRDRSMENDDDDRAPGRGRRRMPTPARLVPAAVALGVPAVLVPLGLLFAGVPGPSAEALPLWAVEAFGPDPLGGATAVAWLPGPVLLLVLALPLAAPTAASLLGQGTVGRWASLAGACLLGAAGLAILAVGLLLRLVAPAAPAAAARLALMAGLAAPVLAIEAAGCLLAAATAPAGEPGLAE